MESKKINAVPTVWDVEIHCPTLLQNVLDCGSLVPFPHISPIDVIGTSPNERFIHLFIILDVADSK